MTDGYQELFRRATRSFGVLTATRSEDDEHYRVCTACGLSFYAGPLRERDIWDFAIRSGRRATTVPACLQLFSSPHPRPPGD